MIPQGLREQDLQQTILSSLAAQGYEVGTSGDFDADIALDRKRLLAYLRARYGAPWMAKYLETPQKRVELLDEIARTLQSRGVTALLREGIPARSGHPKLQLMDSLPDPLRAETDGKFKRNIFSVLPELRYESGSHSALDLGLFINGLPVATVELKNSQTGQGIEEAKRQYMESRQGRAVLLRPGVCAVHWAVSDVEVAFTTELQGGETRFFPFNRGFQDGAGNPPCQDGGYATQYLWEQIWVPETWASLLLRYAQTIEERPDGRARLRRYLFPRYHQWECVEQLIEATQAEVTGQRYLVQHSAGSGKSYTIAWLSYRLASLLAGDRPHFSHVLVVVDRRNLDSQLTHTLRSINRVHGGVKSASSSREMLVLLSSPLRVIVTTVQKFPHVLSMLGAQEHGAEQYAVVIDEAHSSQTGRDAAAMVHTLEGEIGAERDYEALEASIAARPLGNVNYYAFTATPKRNTLELFGTRCAVEGEKAQYVPFHTYTMQQAIDEGYILDVLAGYTPVKQYMQIAATTEQALRFEARKARREVVDFAAQSDKALGTKSEDIVYHFLHSVQDELEGRARGMVVCESIESAVRYYRHLKALLARRGLSSYVLIAFSGEKTVDGELCTEQSLNGFPESQTATLFQTGSYRLLVVANKYLTGFDAPLLVAMYVDKPLRGVQAVQTLSRLNRIYPGKSRTFVLDFREQEDDILSAFRQYYRVAMLEGSHDFGDLARLEGDIAYHNVYGAGDVTACLEAIGWSGSAHGASAILSECVARYEALGEEAQAEVKGKMKRYVRLFNYFDTLLGLPGELRERQLSFFYHLLVLRLPSPRIEADWHRIRELVVLEDYRTRVRKSKSLILKGPAEPLVVDAPGFYSKVDKTITLQELIREFNERFSPDSIPPDVAAAVLRLPEQIYSSGQAVRVILEESEQMNARRTLQGIIDSFVATHEEYAQLFAFWGQNSSYKEWVLGKVFEALWRWAHQRGA